MTTHCGNGHKSSSKGGPNAVNIAGRIAAMALAVASAALMATASQCTVLLPNGSPAHTVTYSDFSPFVYLVAANAIAAFMVGAAIILSVWKKGKGKPSRFLLPFLDAAAPALLYSATGAAFAAGQYMSYCSTQGRRVSVCDVVAGEGAVRGTTRSFCSQVHMAMYISLAAAAAASAAELAKNVPLSLGCGSDGSDSESEAGGCGHGCHSKH
ncbi:CASP-like protein 1U3 [Brachypodium distachyon]|uniref:CASP-like protein n=1 Tax=Brachypodium distachyon TaxID=15368 RepID=A0A0Q3EIB2_BRADI|nr:CASP-like protein 1U3 [Brachypodium distachyon]KQJ87479.1 hypothetical protein BRADI_4g11420v3 [Brachypodium distachyon]|eukprot:XP_003575744.1 CASP-like protein 1U3 [Brachypodium distachyon]